MSHRGVCRQVERHLTVVPAVAIVTLLLEHQSHSSLEQQDVETVDIFPKHVVPEDSNQEQSHHVLRPSGGGEDVVQV